MSIRDRVILRMKEIFGDDQKRINHALKVLRHAEDVAEGERLGDKEKTTVILTAILHDIGIQAAERKHGSSAGPYQEQEGPPIAAEILKSEGVEPAIIERVCYIVGGHHTWAKNNGIDFQILWEADLLVNIEEEGLAGSGADMVKIIKKNFHTETGRRIAEELYLNPNKGIR
jgi:HD superfamily phosphodiesterase